MIEQIENWSDKEWITEMIKSFRVQDLREFCGFAGLPKSGVKKNLLDRCLKISLTEENIAKIKDIVDNMPQKKHRKSASSTDQINMSSRVLEGNRSKDYSSSSDTSTDSLTRSSTFTSTSSSIEILIETPIEILIDLNTLSTTIEKNQENIPEIKFRTLAFYDLKKTIVETTHLKNIGKPASNLLNHFILKVPIISNWELSKTYIRFGYIDEDSSSKLIEDGLPNSLMVTFNGCSLQLPDATSLTSQQELILPFEPILIDKINKQNVKENVIRVFWRNQKFATRKYYTCIEQLVSKSFKDVLMNLEKSKIFPKISTLKMIRDKLVSDDADFQIETSTLNVSLLCPLLNSRMTLPGRANSCKHLQCFDLKSFLMLNEKNPKWKCPVCRESAYLEDLQVDELMSEICVTTDAGAHEIFFDKDGQWSFKENKSGSEGYESEEELMDVDASIIDLCDSFT